jgi:catechol 2,3-dioxygenase-like lactoylglutathione lyase family enzyme
MGQALVDSAAGDDPGVGLRAVRSLAELADRLEILQARRARALGWSWQDIADALGVTPQARRPVRHGLAITHPLTTESRGVRRFFVRDPDGHLVNIVQHRE